jgi:hypothetical protein
VLPPPEEGYGMLIHMPVTRRKKYWIQEKNPRGGFATLNDRLETFDRYYTVYRKIPLNKQIVQQKKKSVFHNIVFDKAIIGGVNLISN